MEELLKTKEVSERIGVNPTTVQRWVKYFGLACETNEHGHYLFDDTHLKVLCSIHEQLQAGKRMKEVNLDPYQEVLKEHVEPKKMVQVNAVEKQLEQCLQRINELEQRLSQKADEVVSYQILKHRTEIDDMMKLLHKIEQRLTKLEDKVEEKEPTVEALPLAAGGETKKKRLSLIRLFSF
ncbi:chromosome-anchoring protein RacA [Halalkalibacterium ligniniphilum]|uniref:chromosome-anchoring protein RacA n=1 Tax=Halalkalibacterium ligniniphilum TaxID=1134413 RepID=UPI000349CEF9|nr:chromosome-anchoring protein RacA [Halalkalibacterium ligniniphilum]